MTPIDDLPRPPVLWWYRVFGIVVGVVMVAYAVFLFSLMSAALGAPNLTTMQRTQVITGLIIAPGVYGFMGLIYAVAPFLVPRTFASYIFHAIIIGASMIGCCTIPVAGALLYFWFQSDMRMYFGLKP